MVTSSFSKIIAEKEIGGMVECNSSSMSKSHFYFTFFSTFQFFLNYHKQATNKLYNDIKSIIACFLLESCDSFSSSIHHYFNSFDIGQCFIDARRIALMLCLLRGEKHPQGTLSDLLTPLLNNLSRIYT